MYKFWKLRKLYEVCSNEIHSRTVLNREAIKIVPRGNDAGRQPTGTPANGSPLQRAPWPAASITAPPWLWNLCPTRLYDLSVLLRKLESGSHTAIRESCMGMVQLKMEMGVVVWHDQHAREVSLDGGKVSEHRVLMMITGSLTFQYPMPAEWTGSAPRMPTFHYVTPCFSQSTYECWCHEQSSGHLWQTILTSRAVNGMHLNNPHIRNPLPLLPARVALSELTSSVKILTADYIHFSS